MAKYVKLKVVFRNFGIVKVVGKSDLVTYKGPTMLASMLHSIAILLKLPSSWDWFINLSASDYPLMTQDISTLILLFSLHCENYIWCYFGFSRT